MSMTPKEKNGLNRQFNTAKKTLLEKGGLSTHIHVGFNSGLVPESLDPSDSDPDGPSLFTEMGKRIGRQFPHESIQFLILFCLITESQVGPADNPQPKHLVMSFWPTLSEQLILTAEIIRNKDGKMVRFGPTEYHELPVAEFRNFPYLVWFLGGFLEEILVDVRRLSEEHVRYQVGLLQKAHVECIPIEKWWGKLENW